MSDQKNPDIQRLFAQAENRFDDDQFTADVMSGTDRLRRKKIILRLVIGLVVSAVMIPMQDIALAFTQVLMTSLVHLDNTLVAQLLAPVNSVGGVMSAIVLGLRVIHKRIF